MTEDEFKDQVQKLLQDLWPRADWTGEILRGWMRSWRRQPVDAVCEKLRELYQAKHAVTPNLRGIWKAVQSDSGTSEADEYDALSPDQQRVRTARSVHPEATDGMSDEAVLHRLRLNDMTGTERMRRSSVLQLPAADVPGCCREWWPKFSAGKSDQELLALRDARLVEIQAQRDKRAEDLAVAMREVKAKQSAVADGAEQIGSVLTGLDLSEPDPDFDVEVAF